MKKKKKYDPIKLVLATRKCECSHCFYLWQLAYDPEPNLSYEEIREGIDAMLIGKRRPK